jgi:dihydrofolate synthase/folylpolyglutamate synthase
MNFEESVSYLFSLGHEVLAAKYGLESIRRLLDSLGNPHEQFKSVLVAGTNGKGSVAAMIDSIARAAGHRTALYTSPHLVRVQERIKIDGREISEADFARLATEVRAHGEALVARGELPSNPTFFEQITAIALGYFREQSPVIAVLEVGLGGRLDATNSVEPLVSVITAIDYDHRDLLGSTIEEIAGEKAAIIKPGGRAVLGRQRFAEAVEVFMRRCLEVNVLPVFVNEPQIVGGGDFGRVGFDYESSHSNFSNVMVGLRGRHQADNAACAIDVCELLNEAGIPLSREAILSGIRQTRWPGRLELIDDRPVVLLDGAHNAGGAKALRAFLGEFCHVPITLLFGAMKDKDIDAIASALFDIATTIVLTHVKDPRAARGPQLAKPALLGSRNVIFTETVRQAVSWARSVTPPDGLVCVAGSLHLVGEVKRLLEEEESQGAVV